MSGSHIFKSPERCVCIQEFVFKTIQQISFTILSQIFTKKIAKLYILSNYFLGIHNAAIQRNRKNTWVYNGLMFKLIQAILRYILTLPVLDKEYVYFQVLRSSYTFTASYRGKTNGEKASVKVLRLEMKRFEELHRKYFRYSHFKKYCIVHI